MPELPEAETIARRLDEELAGRTLGKVDLTRTDIVHGDPRPLGRLVSGRHVVRVHRRAKRIVVELAKCSSKRIAGQSPERKRRVARPVEGPRAGAWGSDGHSLLARDGTIPSLQLVFHLGMSGQLIVCDRSEEIEKHTHLRIAIRGTGRELRFRDPRRFGGVWCLTGGTEHVGRRLSELGPEPLELTPARFRELLNRPRQIKALLLDQRVVAGLGNIYCDEALHAAGLHSLAQANGLDRRAADRLLRAIKSTLRRAIRHKGSTMSDYRTADGTNGSFQKYHRAYQREGEPCKSCGTPIERITAAGRSTFLCPACQRPLSTCTLPAP